MSDVADSKEHQLVLGLGATVNRPSASGDATMIAGTADAAYRYSGFSALVEADIARNQTAETQTVGLLGQAGYFLIPTHLEVAARGAAVLPTASGVTNGYEVGSGLTYFFKGHNLKLQTDYAMLINSPLVFQGAANAGNVVTTGAAPGFNQDQVDHRIRTQLQLYF